MIQRCALVVIVGAMMTGLAGCGGQTAESTSTGLIGIENTQLFVTITNKTGLALTNIRIEVVPAGPASFSVVHSRLETGEKRDFPVGDFRGRDGTPLNLRVSRPRTIIVTAKDLQGKDYKEEIAWK